MSTHNEHNPSYQNGANGSNGANGTGQFSRPNAASNPLPDLLRLRSEEDRNQARFSAFDYVRLLWRGKWIILTCLMVAGLISAYYTYSLPFVYQSSVQILVDDKNQGKEIFGPTIGYWEPPDRKIKKEMQLMTSRKIYDSTAIVLLGQRYLDPTGKNARKDSVIPIVASIEKIQAARLKKRSPADRHDLMVSEIASALPRLISVVPSKDADILQVNVRSGDPVEAAVVANTYARVYERASLDDSRKEASTTSAFIGQQMDRIRDSLAMVENAMQSYMSQNGIADIAGQIQMLGTAKSTLENELNGARIALDAVSQRLAEEKRQLASIEPTFSAEIAEALPPYIMKMQQQIAEAEIRKQTILATGTRVGSKVWYDKQMRELDQSINTLKAELKEKTKAYTDTRLGSLPSSSSRDGVTPPLQSLSELKGKILADQIEQSALQGKVNAINGALSKSQGESRQLPEQQMMIERFQRQKASLESALKSLSDAKIKIDIDREGQFSNVEVVNDAKPNGSFVSPNRPANIMTGSMVGVVLGIGIVLLIAFLDTTIHSPDELEKRGFTVLTAIAPIDESKLVTKPTGNFPIAINRISPHLLSFVDPKSPVAESYRSLRTAIQFASIEKQVRVILLTSSIPQEGKSTTSTNMAIVIAQSGARTLLVDCDLRRPIIHSVFGVGKEPGLVNALVGGVPVVDACRPSGIPNLDLLTSGSIPPNPSELLGSNRMRDVLDQLKEHYDVVVLDSPPISAVTDAVILSTMSDVVITVVRAHRTKFEFLEKTRDDLERVSTASLGIVLNDFDAAQSYGSTYKYYRYYKYYSYYGQSEEDSKRKKRRAEAAEKNETMV